MSSEIRLNSPLLPVLVGLAIIMQLVDSSRIWMTLLVTLGGVWIISYLWARQLATHLKVKREMRYGWAQVGDLLEERITLTNTGPFPALWIEVVDHSDIPGYKASVVSQVSGQAKNQWKTQGSCTRRGLFTLGPTSLHTSDPFGIYQIHVHDPSSATLMVTPPVVPLPLIQVAPGGRAGSGRPFLNAPERTVSASNVREYQPGDSLKWIHWRTSARRDDLFVRVFDSTPTGDWWIFVDMHADVQVGEGWDSTLEHGIVLAASLADRGLYSGVAVGMAANSSDPFWLPPRRSESQRWEILRSLAMAESGEQSCAEWLIRNRLAIGQRTSLVLITPNLNGDWIETIIPFIRRGVVPTVLLLDPRSFGGQQSPGGITELLSQLGITHYVITADILDRPEAQPGEAGHWKWHISATGRAIAIKKPESLVWKPLT